MSELPQANPAAEAITANPSPEAEHDDVELSTETPESFEDFDDSDAETTEQPDDTVEIEIDGKPERVKLDELKLGYQRDRDYRQKTMALAETRKALEYRQAQLDSVVSQGEALVQALSDEFQAEFKDVNWGELAANDPAKYVQMQHAATQRQAKLQAALYRLNEARQAQNSTSQQAQQERLKQEQSALLDLLPEWRDAKRYQAESAEISEYLSKSGYKPDEVAGVTDHRAVLLARKAMLYDRLKAKVPKATPTPNAPPPPPPAPTKAKAAPDPERMPMDQWVKWRERDLAKKRAKG